MALEDPSKPYHPLWNPLDFEEQDESNMLVGLDRAAWDRILDLLWQARSDNNDDAGISEMIRGQLEGL
jgi:hypothetical protein